MARGRQDPDDWDIEYDPTAEFDSTWHRDESVSVSGSEASSAEPPVTVEVDDVGVVVGVSLAADWKKSVDPRALHTAVISAAQTATMQVLARNAEQMGLRAERSASGAPADVPELSPLNPSDVQRLLDEVYVDIDRFAEQVSQRLDRTASVTSAGGHVQGSATKGQIHDLSIDPNWSSVARKAEIESELNDVLSKLGEQSSAGDLAQGPQSRAISELKGLVSDPQLFLRRIGLPSQY
jgi:hypothetical protein